MRGVKVEKLIKSDGPMVSAICRRMIQNEEVAKEAAQEAWSQVIKSIDSYENRSAISTWIYKITYRVALNYAQNEKIYSLQHLKDFFRSEDNIVEPARGVEKELWVKENCNKCLVGILHCLTNEDRLIYILKDISRLSYTDLETVTEIPSTALRKRITRIRKKLKDFLDDECLLYNPRGTCNCRMKPYVREINLEKEFQRIREMVKHVGFFSLSHRILPKKNYWEKFL